MMYIAIDSHLETTGKSLENTLYLMMLIVALCLDVQIDLGTIAERLKEVEEHLSRHVAYIFAFELCIPYEPWTAAKVEGTLCRVFSTLAKVGFDLTQTIIHWKAEAISANTSLVAKGLRDTLA